MCDLMRRILYYENVLEFKEMTSGQLQHSEVHNLNLCRICLAHTNFAQDDVCIVGTDGGLLNVEQMLVDCAGVQARTDDTELPKLLCRDCVQKLSTLYFFRLQAQRAQLVLTRLLTKLGESQPVSSATEAVNSTTANEFEVVTDSSSTQNQPNAATQQSEEAATQQQDVETTEEQGATHQDYIVEVSLESVSPEEKPDLEESLPDDYYLEELQQNEQEDYTIVDDVKSESAAEPEGLVDVTKCIVEPKQEAQNDSALNAENMHLTEQSIPLATKVAQRQTYKSSKPLLANLCCTLCDKEFSMQRLLVAHVNHMHPNVKAFKCRICDSMFAHMQSLSRHMRTHKSTKSKSVCNLCGKSFLRGDDWKRHMRVHTGERPYACHQCDKAFKQINELKEHQLTHINEKLYECDICGVRLSSRNGIYIHKKAHAGIKNFGCEECGKRFITNGELKSHLNMHAKRGKVSEMLE